MDTQSIPSRAADVATPAAPTIEVATPMRVLTAGATIMVATITTTPPDATGAEDIMAGPTADGARESAGDGAGVGRLGSVSMDIISTRTLSMRHQHFGSLI